MSDTQTRIPQPPPGTQTTADAATQAGITARQLGYWANMGWLETVGGGQQGHPLYVPDAEVKVAQIMGALVADGITPRVATDLAHRLAAGQPAVIGGFRLERAA
jgi:DNA-binding transcriptional MerR regulator